VRLYAKATSSESNSENVFRFIGSIKVPFALVYLRDVFEFEFLFFAPLFSRFHLVQSSLSERNGFVLVRTDLMIS
jgi:hypothetical protein